jgi:hypothetical protein
MRQHFQNESAMSRPVGMPGCVSSMVKSHLRDCGVSDAFLERALSRDVTARRAGSENVQRKGIDQCDNGHANSEQ